jgi:hypothetical protein
MEDSTKKTRSPQFPFIPLEKAVARAREFEAEYRTHPARAANAVKVWGYGEKSSGGVQTIAALSAYGLMDDEGSLDSRKLKLSSLAMTILKDARSGMRQDALKTAALKPRVIAELWSEWRVNRPPDQECVSILHLDKKFSEEAATRLLNVYDATISYAGLADEDKITDTDRVGEEAEKGRYGDKRQPPDAPKPGKVPLMENERVVFAHELRPNQSFRIVVTGVVDAEMINALRAFAEFQSKLVATSRKTPANEGLDAGTKE